MKVNDPVAFADNMKGKTLRRFIGFFFNNTEISIDKYEKKDD